MTYMRNLAKHNTRSHFELADSAHSLSRGHVFNQSISSGVSITCVEFGGTYFRSCQLEVFVSAALLTLQVCVRIWNIKVNSF